MEEESSSSNYSGNFANILFTPRKQLKHLSVNIDDFKGIPGKVLVANCGKQAELVEYLRMHSIDAYGMDARLQRSAPYLLKKHVYDVKPRPGHVPWKDNSFVKVISYMNPSIAKFNLLRSEIDFNSLESDMIDLPLPDKKNIFYESWKEEERHEELKDVSVKAALLLTELVRITNNVVGQLFVYPNIGDLEKNLAHLTQESGYSILKEKVRKGSPFEFFRDAYDDEDPMLYLLDTLDHCTVIQPENIITID